MPDILNLLDGVVVQAQLDQRCQVHEVVNLVNVCTGRLSRAQRMQSGHTNSLLNDKRSIRSSESAGISYVFVSPSSPLPSECCSLTSALMDCMTRPSSTTTDRSRGGSGGPLMLYYPCVTWSCDKTEARIAIDTCEHAVHTVANKPVQPFRQRRRDIRSSSTSHHKHKVRPRFATQSPRSSASSPRKTASGLTPLPGHDGWIRTVLCTQVIVPSQKMPERGAEQRETAW